MQLQYNANVFLSAEAGSTAITLQHAADEPCLEEELAGSNLEEISILRI